jgi:hypothetical protein
VNQSPGASPSSWQASRHLSLAVFFVCGRLPMCFFSSDVFCRALALQLPPLLYMKALVFALGSILFGLIIKNRNDKHKSILWLANCILIVSLIIISIVTWLDKPGPLLITLAFLPFIIDQIIPSNILYPLCLNYLPHAKARVSAIIQGGRLILTSIGLQIAGYFYLGTFQNIGIILTGFVLIVRLRRNCVKLHGSTASTRSCQTPRLTHPKYRWHEAIKNMRKSTTYRAWYSGVVNRAVLLFPI